MDLPPTTYRLLADLILVLHLAIVLFNVGGLIAVWIGHWRRWGWVRNRWLRLAHLLAMGFVAVQALLGRWCPLTVWESELRRLAGQQGYAGGFLYHWIQRLLYFALPSGTFALLYVAFFGLVLWTWRRVPPRAFGRRRPPDPGPSA